MAIPKWSAHDLLFVLKFASEIEWMHLFIKRVDFVSILSLMWTFYVENYVAVILNGTKRFVQKKNQQQQQTNQTVCNIVASFTFWFKFIYTYTCIYPLVFTVFIKLLINPVACNCIACMLLASNWTPNRHFVLNWISTNKILIIRLKCFCTQFNGKFSLRIRWICVFGMVIMWKRENKRNSALHRERDREREAKS